MKKPPFAFLFGKHPPPLDLVREVLLDAFCTDRGTMQATDLPELDLTREWWCVTRAAFHRLFLHYSTPPHDGVSDVLIPFLPFYRPKRSEYWRRFTRPATDENEKKKKAADVAARSGAKLPAAGLSYTDFHRFLRQLTEPHGLIWIKTINYLGTQEYPAFYVGFPTQANGSVSEHIVDV